MVVTLGPLDSFNSVKGGFEMLEYINKDFFFPSGIIFLQILNGSQKIIGEGKGKLEQTSKGWVATPHGLHSEGLRVRESQPRVEGKKQRTMVRFSAR